MLSLRPKLSVIIIAYNEEAYIRPCLEAIQHQNVAPDEVIVVDNNSTDNTVAIAKSFPFVRIVHEREQGMIPARDAGFNVAQGDLLARIDADTQVPPDWVKNIHKVLDQYTNKIYGVSGPQYFYALKIPILRKIASACFSLYGYFGITRMLLGHETLFGSNMIITKRAWDKIKHEVCHDSHTVHEDIDLAIHIGNYGTLIFDKRLIVGISARPLHEGTRKQWWRLRTWITTITQHRKLFVGPTSTG